MLNRKHSGFTLIEILVVLLLVGIILGFAVLAFGDFGASRKLRVASEDFANYMAFIRHNAILESSTYAIKIEHGGYVTLRYIPPDQWQVKNKQGIFKTRFFPTDTLANLTIRSPSSMIIINSAGDITPFTLTLSTKDRKSSIMVIGYHNGDVLVRNQSE